MDGEIYEISISKPSRYPWCSTHYQWTPIFPISADHIDSHPNLIMYKCNVLVFQNIQGSHCEDYETFLCLCCCGLAQMKREVDYAKLCKCRQTIERGFDREWISLFESFRQPTLSLIYCVGIKFFVFAHRNCSIKFNHQFWFCSKIYLKFIGTRKPVSRQFISDKFIPNDNKKIIIPFQSVRTILLSLHAFSNQVLGTGLRFQLKLNLILNLSPVGKILYLEIDKCISNKSMSNYDHECYSLS